MKLQKVLVSGASMAVAVSMAMSTVNVHAKVSAEEAGKLKDGTLMPLGGEKKGNGGAIPAWDGGHVNKDHKAGERYTNPWSGDKPEFEITKANMGEHKDKLTAGQIAMLEKYDTYKIPVYKTRRSAAAPDFVYEATFKNATTAELANDGEALNGAAVGIPFPIPKVGHEIIWNHKTRYRGQDITRYNNQAAVQTSGAFTMYKLKEDVRFNYNIEGKTPADLNNLLVLFMQITEAPARQAGNALLVHDTLDQVKEARKAWLYNSGQRRVRRAPNVAYDNPGTGADGLRTNDQLDFFNGATDRYTWKLVGKTEKYIPVNSFELHSDKHKYNDIINANHIKQDLTRYELRRVWEVDSTLKDGTSHIYKRRTFFVDEDTWSMALADIYDNRDELWRHQEAHFAMAYDLPAVLPVAGIVYDLLANRYLVMDLNNEETEVSVAEFSDDYFTTANLKKVAR